jgi:hypothetical protein
MSIYCPLSEAIGIEFDPAPGAKAASQHYYDETVPSPFKGQKHTEETKKQISNSHKGKTFSTETLEKMRLAKLGKKLSDETKRKMSENRKGEKNGFYGKKHSQETIDKIKVKCKTYTPWNKGKHNES